jgi:hypothetical protein
MRPAKTKIKKFRLETKYVHHRSEGLTRRQNRGTRMLVIDDDSGRKAHGRRRNADPDRT